MFEQLKNWVKPSPATSISEVQKHENELIELFIQQSAVISENPDLPQKVKPQLDNIVFNLKQIDMMKLPIDIQVKIERISNMEKGIKELDELKKTDIDSLVNIFKEIKDVYDNK